MGTIYVFGLRPKAGNHLHRRRNEGRQRPVQNRQPFRRGAEEEEQTTETFTTEHPGDTIRKILAEYKSPKIKGLPPFTGGLVGYFSYDYLGYSEPAVRTGAKDTESFKDVDLMLFDKVIAFDNYRQKIILIVNMSLEEPETGYNRAVLELEHLAALLRTGRKKRSRADISPAR